MRVSKSDRGSLIRLASTLPKGSPERRAILAGLKAASPEWPQSMQAFRTLLAKVLRSLGRAYRLSADNIEAGLGPSQSDDALSRNFRTLQRYSGKGYDLSEFSDVFADAANGWIAHRWDQWSYMSPTGVPVDPRPPIIEERKISKALAGLR